MSRRADILAQLLIRERQAIRVQGTPLWIDSLTIRELCFVSHAHRDHVAEHHRVLATKATLDLLGWSRRTGAIPCSFQHPFGLGDLRLELLPSGHIPGGAQLLIRHRGARILFSSDVYDDVQRFSRPLVMTTCDVLVLEATYGTPRHRFPRREQAAELLRQEVASVLDEGGTPLVLVEGSLGRAQEILAELGQDGHTLIGSKSIVRWNRRYRELGYDVATVRLYGGRPPKGAVLVYPMRSRGLKGLGRIKHLVKIACSGQVGGVPTCRRLGVDRIVPFVDHADFDGLIRIAEACRPTKVLTIHGHAESLARALTERGMDAEALEESPQLTLNF